MRVAVTGATGLIGGALCRSLTRDRHDLVILARNVDRARQRFPSAQAVGWQATSGDLPAKALEGLDAVVHLAGEPVAAGRWNEARKTRIRESRVAGTRNLVQALARCPSPPRVFLSSSGIGYYGSRGDEELDEASGCGSDFLSETCRQWEAEAERAGQFGVRVVTLRTGLVLSTAGGALPRMLPPFRMFVGGPIGSGKQWMSWVHIDDQVGAIRHLMEKSELRGPVNLTAPGPVRNSEFTRLLARALGRPALFPVPAFALRLLLGEMAEGLLLASQRVLPRKLAASGYQFRFTELEAAFKDLLAR